MYGVNSYPLHLPLPGEVLLELNTREEVVCRVMRADLCDKLRGNLLLKKACLEPFEIEEHPWRFVFFLRYATRQAEFTDIHTRSEKFHLHLDGYSCYVDADNQFPGLSAKVVPSKYVHPRLPPEQVDMVSCAMSQVYEPLSRRQVTWEPYITWRTPSSFQKCRLLGQLSTPGWYGGDAPLEPMHVQPCFDEGPSTCSKCGESASPVFCFDVRHICKKCLPSFLVDVQRAMDLFTEQVGSGKTSSTEKL
jgi:hypothetical protein